MKDCTNKGQLPRCCQKFSPCWRHYVEASAAAQTAAEVAYADETPADRRRRASLRGWSTRRRVAADLDYAMRAAWTVNGFAR